MRGGNRPPRRGGPGDRGGPDPQQIGRLRLIIACLGAVIVGLLIALIAGAGGGGDQTTTVTETVQAQTGEGTATTPTATTEAQTSDTTSSGGVSPETEEGTGTTEEVPEGGGDTGGEALPDPGLEDTTEPSGGISPEG